MWSVSRALPVVVLALAIASVVVLVVDGGWWLTAQPMGSSMGLVPSAASYIPSQQLPGTYVSGVASWSAPTLELCRP
ncbi:MAG: hypothetical protein GU355_06445 [Caldivirga sp.]|nr:hypothetical protein [Caldivirga sp.]